MTWLANDNMGNPDSWSSGLGMGLACFGFFAGMAVLVWAIHRFLP